MSHIKFIKICGHTNILWKYIIMKWCDLSSIASQLVRSLLPLHHLRLDAVRKVYVFVWEMMCNLFRKRSTSDDMIWRWYGDCGRAQEVTVYKKGDELMMKNYPHIIIHLRNSVAWKSFTSSNRELNSLWLGLVAFERWVLDEIISKAKLRSENQNSFDKVLQPRAMIMPFTSNSYTV